MSRGMWDVMTYDLYIKLLTNILKVPDKISTPQPIDCIKNKVSLV